MDEHPQDEQQRYEQARRQVGRIKGFYIHATVYVGVNALLLAINLATWRGVYWSFWPLAGWGIGLAAHAMAVYGVAGLWGAQWQERKIRELMRPPR